MDDIPSNIGYLAENYQIGYIQVGSKNKFKWIVKEKDGIKYWKRCAIIENKEIKNETFNIDNLNSLNIKSLKKSKQRVKKEVKDEKVNETILKDIRVRKYINDIKNKEKQKMEKMRIKYEKENSKIIKELDDEKSRRIGLEKEKEAYMKKKELRKQALIERRKRMKEANHELNQEGMMAIGEKKIKTPRKKRNNIEIIDKIQDLSISDNPRKSVKFTNNIEVFNYVKESIPSLDSNELNIYIDKM